MKGSERAELRAEAHHLDPSVHIGHHGLIPAVVGSVDDALRTHELVKVKIGRTIELNAKEAAAQLSASTGSEVIQVIGRTVTLYRHNPELKRKDGDLPPWRR